MGARNAALNAAAMTPAMLLTGAQMALLASAEAIVEQFYCLNHCARHERFTPCHACACFAPAADGHIACDGYAQAERPVGA